MDILSCEMLIRNSHTIHNTVNGPSVVIIYYRALVGGLKSFYM